jgi:hypothetical protein
MVPKEWAAWFRKNNPEETIEYLVNVLRSAAKTGLWHKPLYAEFVIEHLKELK